MATIIGNDDQGQVVSLSSFRERYDAALDNPSGDGGVVEETWGETPTAVANQNMLMAFAGGLGGAEEE